jgi:hypothetical protein
VKERWEGGKKKGKREKERGRGRESSSTREFLETNFHVIFPSMLGI